MVTTFITQGFAQCSKRKAGQFRDVASSPPAPFAEAAAPEEEEREHRPKDSGSLETHPLVSTARAGGALTFICISAMLIGAGSLVSAQQTQWVALPAPVHAPISWQTSTNGALARPAAPGGLSVVGRPSLSELSEFVGAWRRERSGAGELRSFVLEREGVLTAVLAAERTNLTAQGKWELREAAIHFQFTLQAEKTAIPALRETKLFIVREAAGIVLVGEKEVRFVRPKP